MDADGVFNARENYLNINGHKLHFIQFGKGKDIVFLHGWGASVSAFLFVAKKASLDYRVTILDFAGFGDSEEPNFAYGVRDYANDVLCLLDELEIKRCTLVGHSFGGRVAIEISAKHKKIVERLILIDSAGMKPRRKPAYYIKVLLHKIRKKLGLKGMRGSKDYQVLSPRMRQTFVKVVNYYQDLLLKDIVCPTAVFWGKDDKETPIYMFKRIVKGIRGSQGFMLDGGHFSYVDDMNRFMLIMLAFLKGTD